MDIARFMNWVLLMLLGFAIAFIGQLIGCLVVRDGGWDRAWGLLLGMAAMLVLAAVFRPGNFAPDEDIANGLLILLFLVEIVGLWIIVAVAALALHGPARRLADRLRPMPRVQGDELG